VKQWRIDGKGLTRFANLEIPPVPKIAMIALYVPVMGG
jgi:hypothetical protein